MRMPNSIPRSDKGKTHKKYRGKTPSRNYLNKKWVKKERRKKTISTRDPDAPIKIQFFEELPISKESMQLFSKKSRPYMRRVAFHPSIRFDFLPERLCDKRAIEESCLEALGYCGTFQARGFGHNKNKGHCSPFKVFRVVISEHPQGGLICEMTNNYRLWRYKWWTGGRAKKMVVA